jgi:hypothetical protein
VRLSNIGANFQENARTISNTNRMRSIKGAPTIRIANGIDIVSSNSRRVSATTVDSVFTANQTRQPTSIEAASKCIASVSHTQPGVSPMGSTFELEPPTSSCPRREY